MSHGQTVLISLWTCSLLWICVTDLEGFVRFLQVVGLAVAALTGVRAGSLKKEATPCQCEWEQWSNLCGVFCTMSSFGQWWHRHSLCTGVKVPLISVLWSAWSFGSFSSKVCGGINCGVESCTFWIFDHFWKSWSILRYIQPQKAVDIVFIS